ncbi:hypothetical protein B0H11DRAFT_2230915 [Mycena galericulata]|nr:hypothetical protein B0H11DRAFT_2230915 [Mycena galericulata]
MGVLPAASKEHIPVAYQVLLNVDSFVVDLITGTGLDVQCKFPNLDFYPLEFEQDLNGKKQDWEAIAQRPCGLPVPQYPPAQRRPGFHGVNVHGTESRNKSMVVHINNPHENRKTEDVAREMVGQRTFIGWPFLQEGLVIAVSDSLFKYEKMTVVPGTPEKVISNPHAPYGLGHWKAKAERIEQTYSKRSGVITGAVDVLLHVRPLKGLKRLETGAFVKDYEGPDKEQEHAVQMTLSEVSSEDPRFLEREAPALSEEFPEGSKIFFLGEHAYGVAAQVSATTDTTLSVILAVSNFYSPRIFILTIQSHCRHTAIWAIFSLLQGGGDGRVDGAWAVQDHLEFSSSSQSDNQKTNLGLKQRHWEFSDKAIELIREYKVLQAALLCSLSEDLLGRPKFPEVFQSLDGNGDAIAKASDILRVGDPDARVREIKAWLKSKGVRDFEPVSLFCDQLTKETVTDIEQLADSFTANKSTSAIKKAIVKGIPRQAVLKPAHAVYRLQTQHFSLGDRVTMVQDSGGVPLSVKGVVIGLNAKSMDVVWDVPFMSGITLGDRCSQYRGSTVEFNTCLNLTNPQFVTSTNPKAVNKPPPPRQRFGPPAPVQGQNERMFRPPPVGAPVAIMANPNRGGGRGFGPGRGGFVNPGPRAPIVPLGPAVPVMQAAPHIAVNANAMRGGVSPPVSRIVDAEADEADEEASAVNLDPFQCKLLDC